MPNWERFTKRGMPVAGQPFVTIQRKGLISLNRTAHDMLGKPEAVELLYDRDEKIIGLRRVDPSETFAYPVRTQASSNFLIAGTAFTSYYGIDVSVARRYRAAMMDDVLAVDLKQEPTEVTGPRARERELIGATA